jgi:hypothetical protein
MGELLPWMWYSKDYGEEGYRVAVLFNLEINLSPFPPRLPIVIELPYEDNVLGPSYVLDSISSFNPTPLPNRRQRLDTTT